MRRRRIGEFELIARYFAPLAKTLADNEEKIVTEFNEMQGRPADIGGYYYPQDEKLMTVMRPSQTFTEAPEPPKS